ncbi:acyl-CoA thioesterase [Salicibibacter halophilus]|uniref:Acyl-CoA thioesterase n=1 Tax=Salicibibacter halophilus TaxID=2502791 RepID=A0A514LDW4_9BACI|nr:thioesterase family protein [Salicibibacter halophilus]QDI90024.1 acyl-CoA thioesterase [Salicibibacter halophilus]
MDRSFRFSHELRVRYSEIDGQGIVFNAHYMTYLDVAMTEYFRTVLGENWLEKYKNTFDIALVKSTLEFQRPARLDEQLSIWCSVNHIGTSSFTAAFEITKKNDPAILLKAEQIHVNYDASEATSVPIPADVRSLMQQYEGH